MEQQNKPNVLEMIKKKQHILLLQKAQNGEYLTQAQLGQLARYELGETRQEWVVDTEEKVAQAFGISKRAVQYWKKEGMPVTPDGKYDLVEISTWKYVTKNKEKKPSKKENWDDRYRKAKAQREEIKLKQEEGALISVSDVVDLEVNRIMAVKGALLRMVHELPPRMAGKNPRSMQKILFDKVEDILNEFSGGKVVEFAEIEEKTKEDGSKGYKTRNIKPGKKKAD